MAGLNFQIGVGTDTDKYAELSLHGIRSPPQMLAWSMSLRIKFVMIALAVARPREGLSKSTSMGLHRDMGRE